MAAIISLQFMGSPFSASTLAAASKALVFLLFSWPAFGRLAPASFLAPDFFAAGCASALAVDLAAAWLASFALRPAFFVSATTRSLSGWLARFFSISAMA